MLNHHLQKKKDYYAELASNPTTQTEENAFLNTCILNAWFEFDKYFKKLDESPAYYASTALNPSLKWAFLEGKWRGISNGVSEFTWVAAALHDVADLWTRVYDKGFVESDREELEADEFEEFIKIRAPLANQDSNSYASYCNTDCINEKEYDSLLQYWIQYESRSPQLARFAFEMLSIPAMSTECERVLSSAKLLISDTRNHLGDDIIEASECVKSWMNQGL